MKFPDENQFYENKARAFSLFNSRLNLIQFNFHSQFAVRITEKEDFDFVAEICSLFKFDLFSGNAIHFANTTSSHIANFHYLIFTLNSLLHW